MIRRVLWYWRMWRLDRLNDRWEHAHESFQTAWTGLDMNDWEHVMHRLERRISKLEAKVFPRG